MAEFSGFWTTSDSGTGDQVGGYTQAHWAKAISIMSGSSNFEGIAMGFLDELFCSGAGLNKVNVAPGGAIVDGKWYYSDDTIQINIPSASPGMTRIDLIILRVDWSASTTRVTRLAGTQGANPIAPSPTQDSENIYELPLAEVTVTSGGSLGVKDVRVKSFPLNVDGRTLEDNSVPLSKLVGLHDLAYAILFDSDEEVEEGDDLLHLYVPDTWGTLVKVWARVETVGASVEVKLKDLSQNSTLATVTIEDGQSTGAKLLNQSLLAYSKLSLSVTDVGDGTPPLGLHIQLKVKL